ncbi:MAG: hypothetical protein U0T84_02495 [Chitinophagales bacterium]
MAQHLYRNPAKTAAARKLLERLEQDVQLLSALTATHSQSLSPNPRVFLQAHYGLATYRHLMAIGALKQAQKLSIKLHKLFDTYELLSEKLTLLSLELENPNHPISSLKLLTDRFNQFSSLLTQIVYFKTKIRKLFLDFSGEDKNRLAEITQVLGQLKIFADESMLANARFLYLKSVVFLETEKCNYHLALANAQELLSFSTSNEALNNKTNIAGCNMLLSEIFIELGNYQSAIDCGQKSYELFRRGSHNQLIALGNLFYAHFHSGLKECAEKDVETALKSKALDKESPIYSAWLFKKACVLFSKQQFTAVARLISALCLPPTTPRVEMLRLRYLEILTFIEAGDLELAGGRIAVLHRQLQPLRHQPYVARAQAIANLLKTWAAQQFHPAGLTTLLPEVAQLEQLHPWHIRAIDAIPFHHYVQQKAGVLP